MPYILTFQSAKLFVSCSSLEVGYSRCGICVQQDISVLQILNVGPMRQMLLERVAALDALADG